MRVAAFAAPETGIPNRFCTALIQSEEGSNELVYGGHPLKTYSRPGISGLLVNWQVCIF